MAFNPESVAILAPPAMATVVAMVVTTVARAAMVAMATVAIRHMATMVATAIVAMVDSGESVNDLQPPRNAGAFHFFSFLSSLTSLAFPAPRL